MSTVSSRASILPMMVFDPIRRVPAEAVMSWLPVPEKVMPAPTPVMAKFLVVVPASKVRVEAKRLVDDAVVEKKFVVVAEVPVAFTNVKFWRVVEPVNASVPITPVPPVMLVAKRFVEEAVVLKKLVVVAEVPVAKVK